MARKKSKETQWEGLKDRDVGGSNFMKIYSLLV